MRSRGGFLSLLSKKSLQEEREREQGKGIHPRTLGDEALVVKQQTFTSFSNSRNQATGGGESASALALGFGCDRRTGRTRQDGGQEETGAGRQEGYGGHPHLQKDALALELEQVRRPQPQALCGGTEKERERER